MDATTTDTRSTISSSGSDFEHVQTAVALLDEEDTLTEEEQQEEQHNILLAENNKQLVLELDQELNWSTTTTNNNSNIVLMAEMLRGEFRAEIDSLKTENKLLAAKVDSIQAQIGEEKKPLTGLNNNGELKLANKLASDKQANKQLEEEKSKLGEMLQAVRREQMEKAAADKEKKKLEELMEKELKMFKQEMAAVTLESKKQPQQQFQQQQLFYFKFATPNVWGKQNGDITVDTLLVTKSAATKDSFGNVMAKFAYGTFYFELLVKEKKGDICIGVSSTERAAALANGNSGSCYIGGMADSWSICSNGYYYNAGTSMLGYFPVNVVNVGDTFGFGMFVEGGQRVLFATKNGTIHGTPVAMPSNVAAVKELFPSITLCGQGSAVEANFGANLADKPYKYNIAGHKF